MIPKIILKENGKVEIKDLPDWWRNSFGKSNKNFESLTGKWKLNNYKGGCYNILLNLTSVRTTFGIQEYKFGNKNDYIITIVLGDPDFGDSLVFVKEK
ncbi:MAG: hypothetical protein ACR2J3_00980 [Aridibacter sp.]